MFFCTDRFLTNFVSWDFFYLSGVLLPKSDPCDVKHISFAFVLYSFLVHSILILVTKRENHSSLLF